MFTIKGEVMDVCMHECAQMHTHTHTNNKKDNLRTEIMRREKAMSGNIFEQISLENSGPKIFFYLMPNIITLC